MNRTLIITFVLSAFLMGCRGSKPVSPRFYMIEFPGISVLSNDTIQPLPFTLGISDIDVHPAYATSQIAMREDAHEINYFVNHQWATRPQVSLEKFTVSYFNHTPVFNHTQTRFWNIQPDFRLFITVHNLEVLRVGRDFYAHLNLEFRLESSDGAIIDKHLSNQRRLLEKRDLNLFTQAVNNIYYEELDYFARKVHFSLNPAR
jgi:ABC-type uncharacterized transport system auxiliary subunit